MFFNILRIFFMLLAICHSTYTATFRCYKNSLTSFEEAPLRSPATLVTNRNPCINVTRPTTVVASGYKFQLDGPALTTLITTLLQLGKTNVILVNWANEASDGGKGDMLGYTLVALPNSKTVGEDVGFGLARLVSNGMSTEIHFIGFSLGAQLAGYAGRKAITLGLTIPIITALDPARIGYEPAMYTPVGKGSATFVEVLHTDPGGYGTSVSTGDVDFWVDYGLHSKTKLQPGCAPGYSAEEVFSHGNKCSHNRSWQIYNVALTQPNLFVAGKAQTYYEWVLRRGIFTNINYIGPAVNRQDPGNFYLTTTSTSPWGKGNGGLYP